MTTDLNIAVPLPLNSPNARSGPTAAATFSNAAVVAYPVHSALFDNTISDRVEFSINVSHSLTFIYPACPLTVGGRGGNSRRTAKTERPYG